MNYLPLFTLCFLFLSCKEANVGASDQFSSTPVRYPVQPGLVNEASGIVASRTLNDRIWVEEDSDTPAQISLLTTDGKLVRRFPMNGVTNRDWEDLGIGPGPKEGVSYLYMAEIGDNFAQHSVSYVYRFPEPTSEDQTISGIERIAFQYPDGPRDAEAILVDPQTKDIWIVSKSDKNAHVYRLPYPQSTTATIKAEYNGELPLTYITGGSVSSDGNEILLVSYFGAYHWRRKSGQSLADVLQKNTYKTIASEPLGVQIEAICFDKTNSGYYTLPELGKQASVTLSYYKRL